MQRRGSASRQIPRSQREREGVPEAVCRTEERIVVEELQDSALSALRDLLACFSFVTSLGGSSHSRTYADADNVSHLNRSKLLNLLFLRMLRWQLPICVVRNTSAVQLLRGWVVLKRIDQLMSD